MRAISDFLLVREILARPSFHRISYAALPRLSGGGEIPIEFRSTLLNGCSSRVVVKPVGFPNSAFKRDDQGALRDA